MLHQVLLLIMQMCKKQRLNVPWRSSIDAMCRVEIGWVRERRSRYGSTLEGCWRLLPTAVGRGSSNRLQQYHQHHPHPQRHVLIPAFPLQWHLHLHLHQFYNYPFSYAHQPLITPSSPLLSSNLPLSSHPRPPSHHPTPLPSSHPLSNPPLSSPIYDLTTRIRWFCLWGWPSGVSGWINWVHPRIHRQVHGCLFRVCVFVCLCMCLFVWWCGCCLLTSCCDGWCFFVFLFRVHILLFICILTPSHSYLFLSLLLLTFPLFFIVILTPSHSYLLLPFLSSVMHH